MDPLIAKVFQLLKAAFPDAAPEVDPIAGNGRIMGVVVSSRFDGLDQVDRQRMVWTMLRRSLPQDEQQRVAAVLTMTPAEVAE